jgi:hypothetical protein
VDTQSRRLRLSIAQRSDPDSNSYTFAKCNGYGNTKCDTNSYANGDTYCYTKCHPYSYAYGYPDP